MKVVILGGDGMLGHQLLTSWRDRHEVTVTLRRPLAAYAPFGLFSADNAVGDVDVLETERLRGVIAEAAPDAVVNCVGIVKQRAEAQDAIPSIRTNALLPHELTVICRDLGARLVQISTDCVFSGRTGGYSETDVPDPVDLYGRSKLLGEVHEAPAVTLRTSIIGLELSRRTGLVEWFLAQRGMIRGFRRAIYSGLTTAELARLIERLLERHPDVTGVWQVASEPISKYDLLVRLAALLGRTDVDIAPDDAFVCDRSLRGEALEERTGYRAPSWETMLAELAGAIHVRDRADAHGAS